MPLQVQQSLNGLGVVKDRESLQNKQAKVQPRKGAIRQLDIAFSIPSWIRQLLRRTTKGNILFCPPFIPCIALLS